MQYLGSFIETKCNFVLVWRHKRGRATATEPRCETGEIKNVEYSYWQTNPYHESPQNIVSFTFTFQFDNRDMLSYGRLRRLKQSHRVPVFDKDAFDDGTACFAFLQGEADLPLNSIWFFVLFIIHMIETMNHNIFGNMIVDRIRRSSGRGKN